MDHSEEAEKIKQLRDDCLLAKRNYEALNIQLLEELPHFVQLASSVIQNTLVVLVRLQFAFYSTAHTLFKQITDGPVAREGDGVGVPQSSTEIQTDHNRAMAEISQKLIQLSLVPTSLAMTYIIPGTIRSAKRISETSLKSAQEEGEGERGEEEGEERGGEERGEREEVEEEEEGEEEEEEEEESDAISSVSDSFISGSVALSVTSSVSSPLTPGGSTNMEEDQREVSLSLFICLSFCCLSISLSLPPSLPPSLSFFQYFFLSLP